jgi:periplasmic copper chaperone A
LSNVVRRTVLASLLAAALAVVSAGAPAQTTAALVVQDPWIRTPPPGVDIVAAYFTVKNLSKRAVFIVGVTSPLAANAMIHESSTVEGQSRMRMRDRVTVPGGGNVAFEPEGLHVMLTGVNKTLEVGEKVPLTLQLDHGGSIDLIATVRPLDAK